MDSLKIQDKCNRNASSRSNSDMTRNAKSKFTRNYFILFLFCGIRGGSFLKFYSEVEFCKGL